MTIYKKYKADYVTLMFTQLENNYKCGLYIFFSKTICKITIQCSNYPTVVLSVGS